MLNETVETFPSRPTTSTGNCTLMFGESVTTDVAVLVESAALVAVTHTVCDADTLAGAVYRPPDVMVPDVAGKIDHDTAVFELPSTEAVNSCDCDASRLAWFGLTLIVTGAGGANVMADCVVLVGSAMLAT